MFYNNLIRRNHRLLQFKGQVPVAKSVDYVQTVLGMGTVVKGTEYFE